MPVTNGFSQVVFVKAQSAMGTMADPTAAQGLRFLQLDTGPLEQREVRVAKDKTVGRDETAIAYVQGRVAPIPWSIQFPVIPSGAAGTAPQALSDLLKESCGLTETVNGGTSVVYSQTGNPTLKGCTIHTFDRDETFGEQLVDAICQQIVFRFGGDSEMMCEANGVCGSKQTIGQSTVEAVSDGVVTTITLQTAAHAYRFIGGSLSTPVGYDFYAKIDSEIIKVTAVNYSTGAMTVVRAQLGSSGVAHNAGSTIKPYVPTATYLSGVPLSEATGDFSTDNGSTTRDILSGSLTIDTGVVPRKPENGKLRMVAAVVKRMKIESSVRLILDVADQDLFGRANQLASIDVRLRSGDTAGSKWQADLNQGAIKAFPSNLPADEPVEVDVPMIHRGSSGNDTFSLTFT